MTEGKRLTTNAGVVVVDNHNVMTAGPRRPALLKDVWLLERSAARALGIPTIEVQQNGLRSMWERERRVTAGRRGDDGYTRS